MNSLDTVSMGMVKMMGRIGTLRLFFIWGCLICYAFVWYGAMPCPQLLTTQASDY